MTDKISDKIDVWANFPEYIFGEIPMYIKQCLQRAGLNSLVTLQTITTNDFIEIENELKSDKTIATEADRKIFFDLFWEDVQNFRFVFGHRRLIIKMAEYAKTLLENSKTMPNMALNKYKASLINRDAVSHIEPPKVRFCVLQ